MQDVVLVCFLILSWEQSYFTFKQGKWLTFFFLKSILFKKILFPGWPRRKMTSHRAQREARYRQLSPILRLNSWTAFLVEVSGHKIEYSQTRVFVWFSTLIFPFYKKLFMMNRLKFSCFDTDMFVFKSREEYGFLENPRRGRCCENLIAYLFSFLVVYFSRVTYMFDSPHSKKSFFTVYKIFKRHQLMRPPRMHRVANWLNLYL